MVASLLSFFKFSSLYPALVTFYPSSIIRHLSCSANYYYQNFLYGKNKFDQIKNAFTSAVHTVNAKRGHFSIYLIHRNNKKTKSIVVIIIVFHTSYFISSYIRYKVITSIFPVPRRSYLKFYISSKCYYATVTYRLLFQ